MAEMETRSGSSFAIVVPDSDVEALTPVLEPLRIQAYPVQQLQEDFVVQRAANGLALSVEVPAFFVGALAASSKGARALDEARPELELFFGQVPYEALDLSREGGGAHVASVSAWLARRMLLAATGLLEDTASVRQSLATLRRDHEETLERFAELESVTSHYFTPKRVRRLNVSPSSAVVTLRVARPRDPDSSSNDVLPGRTAREQRSGLSGYDSGRVRQLLPARVMGLAALELYVESTYEGDEGLLGVDLYLGPSTEPAHSWTRPADQIRTGWLTLELDRALASREQDATIEVTWKGGSGSSLSLALSHPNPIAEYCASLGGEGLRLQAPLAVRTWSMAPGLSVAGAGSSEPATVRDVAAPSSGAVTRFALGSNELDRVMLAGPSDDALDWVPVAFRETENDIRVHPIPGRTAVGVVRDLRLRDVQSVSALVVIEHQKSMAIEFGLAIVPQQASYAAPEDLIRQWTAVEPLLYTEIVGTVDVTPGVPSDLLLATRMVNDAGTAYAWAAFKRVDVTAVRS